MVSGAPRPYRAPTARADTLPAMPIRTKLLLLLLGISLIPVGVVGWIGQRSTRQLGTRLAADSRQSMTRAAAERLEALIDSHAEILRSQGDLLAFIVREQRREMESLLAAPPPEEAPVYPAAAFDAGEVPGLTPSERHWGPGPEGRREPVMVSHHASVLLAPGEDPAEAADDLARIAAMGRVYLDTARGAPDALFWQFTGLESGVHSAFPGHGGYPAEYDPRERPWYEVARTQADVAWAGPTVDAVTGEVVLSLVAPVDGPDGQFAGVTGVDVRVMDILGEVEIPEAWRGLADSGGGAARVLLVAQLASDGTGERDVVIVGQQSYADGGRVSWDRPVAVERLADRGGPAMAAIAAAIRAGESGQQRATYAGLDSIVAYGAMQAGRRVATLVLIVPVETVAAEAVEAQRRVMHETGLVLRFTAVVLAVVTLAVALIARRVARSVVRPLDEVAEAAAALAAGDFDVRVKVRTRDEIGRLARTFNRIAPQLRDRVNMRSALAVAKEVQQNLLPQHTPEITGLEIAGASLYCEGTGGDYYDFLELSQIGPLASGSEGGGRLMLAVGDVTGHGIAAALLMTTARALLRGRLLSGGTLAETVTDVNRHLSADAMHGRFMTMYLMVIDSDASLRWVSAGHDPAIVYCPARDEFRELPGSGIPLGVDAERTFEEHDGQTLEAGAVVAIGTDGIWEARNEQGEMFGKDRLREVMRRHAKEGAEPVLNSVVEAVRGFRGRRGQEDDITLVVVKRKTRD